MRYGLVLILGVMIVAPAWVLALGPHEILLLVNDRSDDSATVAGWYAEMRHVPTQNVVHVSVQASPEGDITPEAFTSAIWEPAWKAVRERGIEDHILAWVYSVGFPFRVRWSSAISITGLTFLRNRLPDDGDVQSAKAVSPLYAGMAGPGMRTRDESPAAMRSQTFDVYAKWLGDSMPLPAMVLGQVGRRGNTLAVIRRYLGDGCMADGTAPTGTVFFVTSDDVRSKCREWQYGPAVSQLRDLGVRGLIVDRMPGGSVPVIGLMSGTVWPETPRDVTYLPGCMAEHLTSEAAMFESDRQGILTTWLEAGATASAGTVSEPFANWNKFPTAFFFCHYAAGCTMIESLYQAIRSPLQILVVGEPLAQPWAPAGSVRIIVVPNDPAIAGTAGVKVDVNGAPGIRYGDVQVFLDGKRIGSGRALELDTARFADGKHLLRAVAFRTGMVRSQLFGEREIVVRNKATAGE